MGLRFANVAAHKQLILVYASLGIAAIEDALTRDQKGT